MRIEDIRAFLSVAELRHFGQAAEALNITQSALTRRIKSIEVYLGFPIFKRTTRDVGLTEEGEVLVRYWEQCINSYQNGIDRAQMVRQGLLGDLSLGICSYAHSNLLANIAAHLYSNYQRLTLRPQMAHTPELKRLLVGGALHFAFLDESCIDERFESVFAQKLYFAVIAHEGHELAQRANISLADLDRQMISTDNQFFLPDNWNELFGVLKEQGVKPQFRQLRTTSTEIMKQVLEEQGLALVVAEQGFVPLSGLKELEVVDLDLEMNMYLAWLKNTDTPLVRRVAKILQSIDLGEITERQIKRQRPQS